MNDEDLQSEDGSIEVEPPREEIITDEAENVLLEAHFKSKELA